MGSNLNKKEIIGIDFGMSNTSISYISNNDTIQLIPDELGNYIIPTCINLSNSYHRYFKRDISKTKQAEELTTLFFKYIKKRSEEHLNRTINKCILSVPVFWNFLQKEIITKCCKNAGLEVINFIDEPIAGILSLKDTLTNPSNEEQNYIVIDCGGSTIDLSLVSIETNFYEVLKSKGNNDLGGEDLANNLLNYIINKHSNVLKNYNKSKLYNYTKKAKEQLSYSVETSIILEDISKVIRISRNEFNEANKLWFSEFKKLVSEFIDEVSDDLNGNEYVVLLGGTSKTIYLQKIVNEIFNKNRLYHDNSNTSIAIGCCVKAKMLINSQLEKNDEVLLEKINQSIGVEVENGEMAFMISKNSYIPIFKTMLFTNTTEEDNIDINVYSGERRYVKDNDFIGQVNIKFLEKKKRGQHKIKLTLLVNEQNKLKINVETSDNIQVTKNLDFIISKESKENNLKIIQEFEDKIYDMEKKEM